MSGHNKWSKIKHKKAVTDAQKSKVFSKLVKLISVESKLAGGDVNSPNLKTAIEKAKAANMPSDNIERAVKKGADKDSATLEANTYEAYGPGGVAMIIETLTDNKNRIAAEVKHILSKKGFSFAGLGSVTWAFDKKDGDWIPKTTTPLSEEDSKKLDSLIEEFEENEDVQEVYTNKEE
ncbi:YebC/PmpR family DNA-binding transcriptional regulator [Patescibacteria group bacterium]